MQGELEALRAGSVDAESAAAAISQREARIEELQEQLGSALADVEAAQEALATQATRAGAFSEEAVMAKAELHRVLGEAAEREEEAMGLRDELAAAKQALERAGLDAEAALAAAVEAERGRVAAESAREVAALVEQARVATESIAGLEHQLQQKEDEIVRLQREAEAAGSAAAGSAGGVAAAAGSVAAAAVSAAAAAAGVVTPVKATRASVAEAAATPSPAQSVVSMGATPGGGAEDVAAVRKKLHQAIRKGKAIQAERDELKARVADLAGEAAELREQVRAVGAVAWCSTAPVYRHCRRFRTCCEDCTGCTEDDRAATHSVVESASWRGTAAPSA